MRRTSIYFPLQDGRFMIQQRNGNVIQSMGIKLLLPSNTTWILLLLSFNLIIS
uniref:Transmembrane protein n=1 Tax=Medicago truncatula TaxID=3880 RepID=I3SVN1_MEDTR|nr:unknown [Medicago truncatula]